MTQPTEGGDGSVRYRANRRPAHVRAPQHWQTSAAPKPKPPAIDAAENQPGGRDPVRYGDWEYKGLAIDF